MYKKRERTVKELIDFCIKFNWEIGSEEKYLISGETSPEDYIAVYIVETTAFLKDDILAVNNSRKQAQRFVDFLFEKEYEIGTFGKAWYDIEDDCMYGFLGGYYDNSTHPIHLVDINGECIDDYKHFEPFTEIPKFKGKSDV